jgi:hypothetical protein
MRACLGQPLTAAGAAPGSAAAQSLQLGERLKRLSGTAEWLYSGKERSANSIL